MQELVLCPICNLDNPKLLFMKDGAKIVRCRQCGLVYVNPRLKSDILHNQYQGPAYFDYYKEMEESDRRTFESRLKKIESRLKPGLLLDIGCARGTFLQVAKERGWQGLGIDISPAAVERCLSLGLTAYCGDLPELKLAAVSFDFINMEDSLEHILNPKIMLTEVYRLLKPGGWLLIRTPDIDSFWARLLGKHWIQIKPNEHIYYFSGETLKKLLTSIGFSVEKTESLGRVYHWGLVAEKLKVHNQFLGKAAASVINKLNWQKKTIHLNLGDEVGVWAYKGAK